MTVFDIKIVYSEVIVMAVTKKATFSDGFQI
jgi:hypothetical protein